MCLHCFTPCHRKRATLRWRDEGDDASTQGKGLTDSRRLSGASKSDGGGGGGGDSGGDGGGDRRFKDGGGGGGAFNASKAEPSSGGGSSRLRWHDGVEDGTQGAGNNSVSRAGGGGGGEGGAGPVGESAEVSTRRGVHASAQRVRAHALQLLPRPQQPAGARVLPQQNLQPQNSQQQQQQQQRTGARVLPQRTLEQQNSKQQQQQRTGSRALLQQALQQQNLKQQQQQRPQRMLELTPTEDLSDEPQDEAPAAPRHRPAARNVARPPTLSSTQPTTPAHIAGQAAHSAPHLVTHRDSQSMRAHAPLNTPDTAGIKTQRLPQARGLHRLQHARAPGPIAEGSSSGDRMPASLSGDGGFAALPPARLPSVLSAPHAYASRTPASHMRDMGGRAEAAGPVSSLPLSDASSSSSSSARRHRCEAWGRVACLCCAVSYI